MIRRSKSEQKLPVLYLVFCIHTFSRTKYIRSNFNIRDNNDQDDVRSPVRSHPRHALTREDLGAGDLVTGGADVPVTRDPGQGDQETGQQPHDGAGPVVTSLGGSGCGTGTQGQSI